MATEDTAPLPRVLIVEDEALIAMSLADMLEDKGYVIVANVGRVDEAVRIAQQEQIDFGIIDVNLIDGTFEPVADALTSRGIAFIVATGADTHALARTYEHVLEKPYADYDVETAIGKLNSA